MPADQLVSALGIISSSFQPASPNPRRPYGCLHDLAQAFTIPDQPHLCGWRGDFPNASLYVLDTDSVQLDLAYVSFIPELGIWQPDPIEAFRSYLHPVCMREGSLYHPDIMSLVSWMSNFIIYATCGVKYIPKPTTEDEW